jgi:hypothetical protein
MAASLGKAVIFDVAAGGNFVKCQGGDSNPYGFLHQILSLARLPIPPPRQIAMLTKVALLAASGKLRL